MKHPLPYLGIMLLGMTVMSCQNEPYPTDTKDIERLIANHFGFQSRMDCPVTLAVGSKSYVEVFDVDPRLNPNAEPIYAIFTDIDGIQNSTMYLPSIMLGQTLYARAGNQIMTGTVKTSGIIFADTNSRSLEPSFNCESLKAELIAQLPSETYNADKLERSNDVNIITVEDGTILDFYYITCSNFLTKINYYYYR